MSNDSFQPGTTYEDHFCGWIFRCDTITTHPEDGTLIALGWRYWDGTWHPYSYKQTDWKLQGFRSALDVECPF
jgi:hypothetical protein